ncbi:MAG TPA: nitronate monooxygenase [Flavobacterium sp.]|nr:nitronate monooxygenase [Flavobacterium sp.]
MEWKNDITRILNIEYPIVQAPMFGVATTAMVVASSKANILGSLPLGDLSPEKCIEVIRETKKLIDTPFAVNIFVNTIPFVSHELKERYNTTKEYIENLAKQHHLDVSLPEIEELKLTSYHEQIEAIITEKCKILSFTFGNLDQQSIDKLKSHGTVLIGTCTSVEEAKILERSGIDIICVQGIEAGGHRGSFTNDNTSQIGGLSLLSQVYDSVTVPLIYAGGIYNAKTLLAVKVLGAQGFQIGSLFLGSKESALNEAEKTRLRNTSEKDIVLTKSFSGKFARGVKNVFIEALENTDYILPYPYQYKLTSELKNVAKSYNNTDFVSIWAGQSLHSFDGKSTAEIISNLIEQTEYSEKAYL